MSSDPAPMERPSFHRGTSPADAERRAFLDYLRAMRLFLEDKVGEAGTAGRCWEAARFTAMALHRAGSLDGIVMARWLDRVTPWKGWLLDTRRDSEPRTQRDAGGWPAVR